MSQTDGPTSSPHVIPSVDGLLQGPPDQIRKAVEAALRDENKALPIVIWFHGGLVDTASGIKLAENVTKFYGKPKTAFPTFFVWETGIKHSLKDALIAVAERALAKGLIEVLSQYAGARFLGGMTPFGFDESKTATIEGAVPPEHQELLRQAFERNEFFQLEAARFDRGQAFAAAEVAETPELPAAQDLDERIATIVAQKPTMPVAMGVASPTVAALIDFGLKLAFAIVKRFARGRQHGLKETVIEEVARSLGLPGEVWSQMKNDAATAFSGVGFVGTDFIVELKAHGAELANRDIYLVGHSAGAIYVAEFLKSAKSQGLGLKFHVRFLAPASRCDLTGPNLKANRSLVRSCRIYGLTTEMESSELLLEGVFDRFKGLYQGSLLMLVSGAFEDQPDVPLAGMRRFMGNEVDRLSEAEKQVVEDTRSEVAIDSGKNSVVWSPGTDPNSGAALTAKRHGDFDEIDLGAVAALLK